MYNHFRSLSIKDELTGLYNHRYFQEKLQELTAKGETLSLLLLDLDHFKIYNDMYGHPQGDKLLQELAKVISGNIPEQGTVYRYGGEEFAVLLPGTDSETALTVAESIRKAVSEHEFEGMKHMPAKRITVSIGVSTFPHMATSKENLLMLADEALYKIKYTSRNKVQLYTSVVDELKSHFDFGSREMELIQMIKTFLTIINSKDRYTYGHTERDMEYAEALARKIGLPEDEIKIIRYGALLHDIGKVEVPTEILNKKTKLTEQEWETMKMHVIWGEEIVKPIKELAPCLPIIRHHHERYDGKGYPDGLQGTAIPLAARILTIVDSFDAMTTNRPYQKTKTIPQAIEEIRRCSGTQFDPHLVEPFIEVIKEIRNAKIQQDVS
ncbi:diguanylate cyclase [Effusibacillus lacus]|uniref:Diguanylate cyclase n=1 Tax=Effusibacillus lacus TaxID=1348429 RepID=A0A292YPX6_9BACL|nr:diguanylate cyclase [Effusibacillus lacus]GAX91236.1 diguanylate cyclase [Effusibacillus lacus]